jgi:hypothetical protein
MMRILGFWSRERKRGSVLCFVPSASERPCTECADRAIGSDPGPKLIRCRNSRQFAASVLVLLEQILDPSVRLLKAVGKNGGQLVCDQAAALTLL